MSVRIPGVGTPMGFGEVELKSDDWNDSHSYHLDLSSEIFKGEIKNTIRQLQDRAVSFSGDGDDMWAEAYVDSDGRMGSVYSFSAVHNTDSFEYTTLSDNYWVIKADNVNESSFITSNTKIIKVFFDTWVVFVTDDVPAQEQRSILFEHFFRPNGITGDPLISTATTNISKLETTFSEDVGNEVHYMAVSVSNGNSTQNITMSFNDTTNNLGCGIWYRTSASDSVNTSTDSAESIIEYPTGTQIARAFDDGPGGSTDDGGDFNFTSDNTDTRVDNPNSAYIELDVVGGTNGADANGRGATAEVMFSSSSDVSFSLAGSGGSNNSFSTSFDYNIPKFSETTATPFIGVSHTLDSNLLLSNINKCFATTIFNNWEDGSLIEYKFYNESGEETNWLNINSIQSFTSFSSKPSTLIVRLKSKETSPTAGFPSIKGFGFKAWSD